MFDIMLNALHVYWAAHTNGMEWNGAHGFIVVNSCDARARGCMNYQPDDDNTVHF